METPLKGGGALLQTPISKKLGLLEEYHGHAFVQTGFIWQRWEREAARLFRLYWRSGDLRHFHAFGRHIDAMRSYGGQR